MADQGNRVVRKISAAGKVTTVALSHEGRLRPSDVAFGVNGTLYIADAGGHTVRKYTKKGVFSVLAGSPGVKGSANGTGSAARFSHPQGVAVDTSGNVYVADTGNRKVRKIATAGKVTSLKLRTRQGDVFSLKRKPVSVAVAEDGTLYVGNDDGTIVMKTRKSSYALVSEIWGDFPGGGEERERLGEPPGPLYVEVTPEGRLLVADRDGGGVHVVQKKSFGSFTGLFGWSLARREFLMEDFDGYSVRFRGPSAVAVGKGGTVYLVDQLGSAVRVGKPDAPKFEGGTSLVAAKGEKFEWEPRFMGKPTRIKMSGSLPSGLKFNKAKTKFSGTPEKSGVAKLKARATNPYGSRTASITLRVISRPTIKGVKNLQVIRVKKGGSATVKLTITDADTSASRLKLSTATTDPSLLPKSALKFSGKNKNRTLKITPAKGKKGDAATTIAVSNGYLEGWVVIIVSVK